MNIIIAIVVIIISVAVLIIFLKKTPSIKQFDFNIFKGAKIDIFRNKEIQFPKEIKKINTTKVNNFIPFQTKENNATKEYTLFQNAEQFFFDKNFIEAEKIYIKIASINPKNLKVYNRLGVIYMEKKNYIDAKEVFALALKLDPKKASRHYNYAMACTELKEYRNAIEAIKSALKIDNKNKKYKEAIKELNKRLDYRYQESKRKEY